MADTLVTAVLLTDPEGTAAAVCTAASGALLAAQRTLIGRGDRRRQLVLASLAGLGLCLIGLLLASISILVGALIWIGLAIAATAIAALDEPETALGKPVARLRRLIRERDTTLSFALGLLLLLAAGVFTGILLGEDGSSGSSSTPIAASGRFRISGTCANGACTVNECTLAAPCGLSNHGRLREGTPVDIVCQTFGKAATAPNGISSTIWDRLPSGLYISDLFVDGTSTGHFTKGLPRCSDA